MNWDMEFQVQIENMENIRNMDAAPPGAAARNLVGSVDSMSCMDLHAYAVSNNPRSMDASMKSPTSTSKIFPNTPPMNPMRVTLVRSNMYQSVSSQRIDSPIHSDMSIAASTAIETFQSDIYNVKEDVQDLKNGMQTIQKMLQQLITPTLTVKTTGSTEPSGLTASIGGTHGPAERYYSHHDKALVPIQSAGILDLMRTNWPGGGGVINILGILRAKKQMMFAD
jgi:hypothetical protein